MNDIFDIKSNMLPNMFDPSLFLWYLIFVIMVLMVLFFSLKKKKLPDYDIEKIDYKKPEVNFLELIASIKEHHLSSPKDLFYQKLKSFLILYLENKTSLHISQMTLKEIEDLGLSKNMSELFKEVYFRQYVEKVIDDTRSYRENLLQRLKNNI